MIPLFIQLTFTKHLPLYFIYLFPHIISFLFFLKIKNLQIKNKDVYKILLEFQLKEKPIAYTKWEKCLKKDRMHTLTCIAQTLSFFSPLANIFCYIYNQSKYVCNFLFLYIPDSHYYLLFPIVLAILCKHMHT
jgi:hypothetical protein